VLEPLFHPFEAKNASLAPLRMKFEISRQAYHFTQWVK